MILKQIHYNLVHIRTPLLDVSLCITFSWKLEYYSSLQLTSLRSATLNVVCFLTFGRISFVLTVSWHARDAMTLDLYDTNFLLTVKGPLWWNWFEQDWRCLFAPHPHFYAPFEITRNELPLLRRCVCFPLSILGMVARILTIFSSRRAFRQPKIFWILHSGIRKTVQVTCYSDSHLRKCWGKVPFEAAAHVTSLLSKSSLSIAS